MNTEDKVTSLELSKKLRSAGCKQESEKVWNLLSGKPNLLATNCVPVTHRVSAFCCAELLEGMPYRIKDKETLNIAKIYDDEYVGGYMVYDGTYRVNRVADTPAEALGKLYLWCLESGHCDG